MRVPGEERLSIIGRSCLQGLRTYAPERRASYWPTTDCCPLSDFSNSIGALSHALFAELRALLGERRADLRAFRGGLRADLGVAPFLRSVPQQLTRSLSSIRPSPLRLPVREARACSGEGLLLP
jgi:hypothetical protein